MVSTHIRTPFCHSEGVYTRGESWSKVVYVLVKVREDAPVDTPKKLSCVTREGNPD